jgi:hypothetical protein
MGLGVTVPMASSSTRGKVSTGVASARCRAVTQEKKDQKVLLKAGTRPRLDLAAAPREQKPTLDPVLQR